MISTGGTEFVEDTCLYLAGGLLIPQKDRLHIFPFRSWTHKRPSFLACVLGNTNYESTISFGIPFGNIFYEAIRGSLDPPPKIMKNPVGTE
jgi:hypothetical protein